MNLFIVSCALAWARSAVADDTICVINLSDYPVKFAIYPLSDLGVGDTRILSLAANAGDQNQCFHVSEANRMVTLGIEVCEGLVNEFGCSSPVHYDLFGSGGIDAMEGPKGGVSGYAKAQNWLRPVYVPKLVGDGTWYKKFECCETNILGDDKYMGSSFDLHGLYTEGYPWPADWLLCTGNTCASHSENAGHGLYRLTVYNRGDAMMPAQRELSPQERELALQQEQERLKERDDQVALSEARETLATKLTHLGQTPEVSLYACGVSKELAESLRNQWINYAFKGLVVTRDVIKLDGHPELDDPLAVTGPLPVGNQRMTDDDFTRLMFKQWRWAETQGQKSGGNEDKEALGACEDKLAQLGMQSQATCVNLLVPVYWGLFDPLRKELEMKMGEEISRKEAQEERNSREGLLSAGEGRLAGLRLAPECSDELRQREQLPQATDGSCADNLFFRTICNSPGYNTVAISLPEDHDASCFGFEALRGAMGFEIVAEDGMRVWDSSKESIDDLKLSGPGVFQIRTTGGTADGGITIRFVDAKADR
ncbi:MAG: hypothetical protein HYW07_02890 [Candidatus Latescibacteria bacterium]|nr:hypothetical protein [Candidatus Latescibacterota bacterium]